MLEGKGDNILDPLEGHCSGVAWEAFADKNFDAAKVVARTPVALIKKLTAKDRKLEAFAFARLCVLLILVSTS